MLEAPMSRTRTILPFALFGILAVALHLTLRASEQEYCLTQLTMAVYYALVVLSLSLVMGYAGQVSLGHGAFFAIGGYTSAVLTTHNFSAFKGSSVAGLLMKGGLLASRVDLYGNTVLTVPPFAAFFAAMVVTLVVAILIG